MYCKKCGKQISDDSNFCQYCGANLTNSNFTNTNIDMSNYSQYSYSSFNNQFKNNSAVKLANAISQPNIPIYVIAIISIITTVLSMILSFVMVPITTVFADSSNKVVLIFFIVGIVLFLINVIINLIMTVFTKIKFPLLFKGILPIRIIALMIQIAAIVLLIIALPKLGNKNPSAIVYVAMGISVFAAAMSMTAVAFNSAVKMLVKPKKQ